MGGWMEWMRRDGGINKSMEAEGSVNIYFIVPT